ncbi:hydrogenase expression protein [Streptomyces sp. HNM0574]|nr:hydrogenase expression protein [Streptomyces sp. HNM0574]
MRLRIRNTGDVVDEYRFEPVGDPAPWTRVEPQSLRLYPGTTGTVELTFAPPRTPDAAAGPHPYAVRITPTEHPDAVTVPEGNLTVTPFTEVRADLVPPTVKGRFRGRPKLAVDNLGNTGLTASISGSDTADELSYEIHPGNVQIEPGRAAFVDATLRPKQIVWFGSAQQRPYTMAVQRSGVEPLAVDGTYVQRGVLPRWLATFCTVFLALAITFVVLWMAYKPQVRTAATAKSEGAGQSIAPTPSDAPPEPEQPKEPEKPEDGGGGDGGGGGGDKPPPQPPKKQGPVPARNVALYNTATEKCADIPGFGKGREAAPVRQFACDKSPRDNQRWHLDVKQPKGGPGGRPLFLIVNAKDGLCMDLPEFGAQPVRTKVWEGRCNGTPEDNQLWWAAEQDDGSYWFRNFASNNKCLDVAGNRVRDNDTDLMLFDCATTDDHGWRIVKTQDS